MSHRGYGVQHQSKLVRLIYTTPSWLRMPPLLLKKGWHATQDE